MAVNKNFVVKNGLEVNTNLIVADTDAQKVGIGTTISRYLLHVNGGTGIGASSVYVTGISTVAQEFNVGLGGSIFTVLGNAEGTAGIGQSVGVGTGEPAYLLDVRSPVSTGQTALYVQGDMYVTGDINLDDITLDQLKVTGISTFIGLSTFTSGISVLGLGATTTTLDVTGVSTFTGSIDANGDVDIDGHTELDDVQVSGIATITNTTQASNKDNGALVVEGGAGIEKNLFVGGGAEITGITTLTNTVDINDSVEIAGITTVQNTTDSDSKDTGALVVEGGVGIEKNLNVGAGLSVVGFSTFADTVQIQSLTDNRVAIVGAGSTIEDDGNLTFDGGQLEVGVGLSVTGISTFVGVGTFISDLYVGGDLYISDNVSLDTNLNILGIATIGTLDITNYSDFGLGIDVAGYGVTSTTLNVTGVSTLGGTVDINNSVEIAGITTLQDTTQSSSKDTGALVVEGGVGIEKNLFVGGGAEVTGILTVTNDADFNGSIDVDGHTELDNLNVSGFSTFVGFATFSDYVFIQDGLNVAGAGATVTTLTISGVSTFTGNIDANSDLDVDGHTELDNVNVSGFSTFVGFSTFNDYVFIQDGLNVTGIITATSFDGLGQIGVGSEGAFIGAGITMVDFQSTGGSNTVDVDGTSGIATVTVTTGVSIGLAIALGG